MYHRVPNRLFSSGPLYAALEAHLQKSQQKVNEIPREKFLASSDELVFEHVKADLYINALVLHEDAMTMKDEETQTEIQSFLREGRIRVPGIRITISIPYTGDSNLWDMYPLNHTSAIPLGEVRRSRGENDGIVEIVIEQDANDSKEKIKNELDRNLG